MTNETDFQFLEDIDVEESFDELEQSVLILCADDETSHNAIHFDSYKMGMNSCRSDQNAEVNIEKSSGKHFNDGDEMKTSNHTRNNNVKYVTVNRKHCSTNSDFVSDTNPEYKIPFLENPGETICLIADENKDEMQIDNTRLTTSSGSQHFNSSLLVKKYSSELEDNSVKRKFGNLQGKFHDDRQMEKKIIIQSVDKTYKPIALSLQHVSCGEINIDIHTTLPSNNYSLVNSADSEQCIMQGMHDNCFNELTNCGNASDLKTNISKLDNFNATSDGALNSKITIADDFGLNLNPSECKVIRDETNMPCPKIATGKCISDEYFPDSIKSNSNHCDDSYKVVSINEKHLHSDQQLIEIYDQKHNLISENRDNVALSLSKDRKESLLSTVDDTSLISITAEKSSIDTFHLNPTTKLKLNELIKIDNFQHSLPNNELSINKTKQNISVVNDIWECYGNNKDAESTPGYCTDSVSNTADHNFRETGVCIDDFTVLDTVAGTDKNSLISDCSKGAKIYFSNSPENIKSSSSVNIKTVPYFHQRKKKLSITDEKANNVINAEALSGTYSDADSELSDTCIILNKYQSNGSSCNNSQGDNIHGKLPFVIPQQKTCIISDAAYGNKVFCDKNEDTANSDKIKKGNTSPEYSKSCIDAFVNKSLSIPPLVQITTTYQSRNRNSELIPISSNENNSVMNSFANAGGNSSKLYAPNSTVILPDMNISPELMVVYDQDAQGSAQCISDKCKINDCVLQEISDVPKSAFNTESHILFTSKENQQKVNIAAMGNLTKRLLPEETAGRSAKLRKVGDYINVNKCHSQSSEATHNMATKTVENKVIEETGKICRNTNLKETEINEQNTTSNYWNYWINNMGLSEKTRVNVKIEPHLDFLNPVLSNDDLNNNKTSEQNLVKSVKNTNSIENYSSDISHQVKEEIEGSKELHVNLINTSACNLEKETENLNLIKCDRNEVKGSLCEIKQELQIDKGTKHKDVGMPHKLTPTDSSQNEILSKSTQSFETGESAENGNSDDDIIFLEEVRKDKTASKMSLDVKKTSPELTDKTASKMSLGVKKTSLELTDKTASKMSLGVKKKSLELTDKTASKMSLGVKKTSLELTDKTASKMSLDVKKTSLELTDKTASKMSLDVKKKSLELTDKTASKMSLGVKKTSLELTDKTASKMSLDVKKKSLELTDKTASKMSLDVKKKSLELTDKTASKMSLGVKKTSLELTDKTASKISLDVKKTSLELTDKTDKKTPQPFKSDDPEESKDIEDPEWEIIKALETDEQRYKQVRACWRSRKIPNPNRDLTYQSFRKQRLNRETQNYQSQVNASKKRSVDQSIDKLRNKRGRTRTTSCTNILDNKIHHVTEEYFKQQDYLASEFHNHVRSLSERHASVKYQLYNRLSNELLYSPCNVISFANACDHMQHESRALEVELESEKRGLFYDHSVRMKTANQECTSKLNSLQKVRNEILQFCSFYKGLGNSNDDTDPTLLSEDQIHELNEIDEMYEIYQLYYGNAE